MEVSVRRMVLFYFYFLAFSCSIRLLLLEMFQIQMKRWKKNPLKISGLLIAGGFLGLIVGSNLTVNSAIQLARIFNVSDNLIGLTLVAIGTSLPELIPGIVAALKKNVDIIIGNVVGSNIFNILFVLGISSLIKPIPFYTPNLFDSLIVLGTTIMLLLSLFMYGKHRITRVEGVMLLFAYALYIGFVVIRG